MAALVADERREHLLAAGSRVVDDVVLGFERGAAFGAGRGQRVVEVARRERGAVDQRVDVDPLVEGHGVHLVGGEIIGGHGGSGSPRGGRPRRNGRLRLARGVGAAHRPEREFEVVVARALARGLAGPPAGAAARRAEEVGVVGPLLVGEGVVEDPAGAAAAAFAEVNLLCSCVVQV